MTTLRIREHTVETSEEQDAALKELLEWREQALRVLRAKDPEYNMLDGPLEDEFQAVYSEYGRRWRDLFPELFEKTETGHRYIGD